MAETMLVARLRPARARALPAARAEALGLLSDLGAATPMGGPLSDQKGVFWITVPAGALAEATARLPRLGYAFEVSSIVETSSRNAFKWKGKNVTLEVLWRADEEALRATAPDRRPFLLPDGAGGVREVIGYRGDGGKTSRRALPVADARMLVNLVALRPGQWLLDPFAGAGGVVLAARAAGAHVASADIDPMLRHGLTAQGALHVVADAGRLPFAPGAFDAIASEPPYDAEATPMLAGALAGLAALLRPGGHLALLPALAQAGPLRAAAAGLALEPVLDCPIDRKGTGVIALAWRKIHQCVLERWPL